MLFPSIDASYFSVMFTVILLVMIIYLPYQRIASILKYLCIALFFYLVVPFLYEQDWGKIAYSTFVPHIELNKEYLAVLVGILGTTISPYLFLWQTSVEVEELKQKKKRIYINGRLLSDKMWTSGWPFLDW